MAEKFYKVAESELVAIAEAIRFQKKLTPEQRKYTLKEMPKVIKAMLVLPSDYGITKITIDVDTASSATLPKVYKGSTTESEAFTIGVICSGVAIDAPMGNASVTTSMMIQTNAV